MTLTATPDRSLGLVRVTLTPPTGTTLTRLARIDRNGRTQWTGVDLTYGSLPGALNDPLCSLVGPIEYVAQWTATSGGAVTLESATTALDLTDVLPRLYRLQWDPYRNIITEHHAGLGMGMRIAYTEHPTILDHSDAAEEVTRLHSRGTGPTVISIPSPTPRRTGSLQLWADTWEHAAGIRDELTRNPVQYLRVPDAAGLDHALIVESVSIDPAGPAWSVTATYTDPLWPVRVATLSADPPYRLLSSWGGKTLEDIGRTHRNLADMWW